MSVFDNPNYRGHEDVHFLGDDKTGLKAIVGVHNTVMGPALGGLRINDYGHAVKAEAIATATNETTRDAMLKAKTMAEVVQLAGFTPEKVDQIRHDAATTDALRLSRGMTYKSAAAGIGLGGGKSVIVADSASLQGEAREEMLKAFGRLLDRYNGEYITAEDSGSKVEDMGIIHSVTPNVCGLPGDGICTDPSPFTAEGTLLGLEQAILKGTEYTDVQDLEGMAISVQGAGGNVAKNFVLNLLERGATIKFSEFNDKAAEALMESVPAGNHNQITRVELEEIFDTKADVFMPSALGGILDEKNISRLQEAGVTVIAGPANNQLATDKDADRVTEAGMLYVPDYIINAAGVIAAGVSHLKKAVREGQIDTQANPKFEQYRNATPGTVAALVEQIGGRVAEIIDISRNEDTTTAKAADTYAERIIAAESARRMEEAGVPGFSFGRA